MFSKQYHLVVDEQTIVMHSLHDFKEEKNIVPGSVPTFILLITVRSPSVFVLC